MRKRNTPLALLCGAVFFATAGPGAAQTTAGVPVIVDARNTVVGPAYGAGVIVSVQGMNVYVDLAHSADNTNFSPTDLFWGLPNVSNFYPTGDCSGPPLIPAGVFGSPNGFGLGPTVTPFRAAVPVRSGGTVTLYIAGTSPASNQQVNSEQQNNGKPACGGFGQQRLAYSVATIVNLTQLHPEPLHVQ
jgi:hypothetical protein